ncbi:MAG: hypothetical protein Q8942_02525 [Bacillota bacterium]|nr:hypothetical protein [Bacillota bacterium]
MTICRIGNTEIEVDYMPGATGKMTLHYRHPLSGNWLESIDDIMRDMLKHLDKKKSEWERIAKSINSDRDLMDLVQDGVNVKNYD